MNPPGEAEGDRLIAELELAHRKLAEAHKMASLGRLSAGIVHDINSPIGSILSNNEVILRSIAKLRGLLPPETPSSALKLLDSIERLSEVDKIACERISEIIRGLKTFARVNESDLRLVDVNELLRNTIKLSGTIFRGRINFECEFQDLPPVECYPGLLNQVFLNLVVNACQAIEAEGTVTVRTSQELETVHISVQDTGGGIPAEVRPRIFAAGFTTKPIGEGTGLGLTISREIVVETHGGRIFFETEVGKGTTFHVYVPIRQSSTNPERT